MIKLEYLSDSNVNLLSFFQLIHCQMQLPINAYGSLKNRAIVHPCNLIHQIYTLIALYLSF